MDNKYLLSIAIGPVQTLIESARRTRDLWCGSWVLSECAKAAAKSLKGSASVNVSLIFPSPDVNLEPKSFDEDYANVANVVRVEVKNAKQEELVELAESAKRAAQRRLEQIATQARQQFSDLPINDDLWSPQLKGILESFAVWVKVEGTNYSDAAKRLKSLLRTRKNSRDFSLFPYSQNINRNIPKSSLDGASETVVKLTRQDRKKHQNLKHVRRLGLSLGEELDTLGVIKRLAGDVEQFSPYPRICAEDWVVELEKAEKLAPIREAYKNLFSLYDFKKDRVTTGVQGNNNLYSNLPYDGELLYDFRVKNAIVNTEKDLKESRNRLKAKKESQEKEVLQESIKDFEIEKVFLEELKSQLKLIESKPVPYGVILKADGDKMGRLFTAATDVEQSQKISKALDGFASDVRKIVQDHRGHAIYAGGDDVLAMLPLSSAIDCAEALKTAFEAKMGDVIKDLSLGIDAPTLSVGIAIGHFMQPLGHLRARAIRAEKIAKGDNQPAEKKRNALGICLGLRSGPEITWRCQWSDKETLALFKEFLGCYAGEREEIMKVEKSGKNEEKTINSSLPSRAGYSIRSIALEYQWSLQEESEVICPLQQAELRRLLDNLQQKGGEESITPTMKANLQLQAERVGLNNLANQLIIARWLSAKTQSDLGAME